MRLLLDGRDAGPATTLSAAAPGSEVDGQTLAAAYAFPDGLWLRANFVSTLDGAGTGGDGLTGSINTPADNRVFALQRRLADVVLVGAGTAAAEGYGPIAPDAESGAPTTLAVVSGRARVPDRLARRQPGHGRVVLLTRAAAGSAATDAARAVLGEENVWVAGEETVDLAAALARLADAGMPRVLAEGGPTLFSSLLAGRLVDELALTCAPRVLGGDGTRITSGPLLAGSGGLRLRPRLLLEEDGTLLGLWLVDR